ncbi:alpha/beta fold hydrolase [Solicola gregarius]|uniref:Alpha/beta fold hydrolase n=1 Tax=Solicola gregarius TaxID=2908642 RepID=A0AA46TF18_9ACTN|nr:alpha/beta fold hydrolase [Solicola gregarius]UYM03891.1 alpha/beta fold hydrolase [Solicola gregarius]
MAEHTVRSGEVGLAVRTGGNASGPTLVMVHGFPDTQQMWDPLAERLCSDHFVVTYDVRGAGASTAPRDRSGYRTSRLVDDLVAVLDAHAPSGAVHLIGHDWGSVQLWDAVTSEATDDRLRGRIASFTSISGPSLDHFGDFMRTARTTGHSRDALRQAAHSWYIAAFHVPLVPEWVFRRFGGRLQETLNRSQRLGDDPHWPATFAEDGANGVGLYRANAIGRMRHQRPASTSVPVQVILPIHDDFLIPALYHRLPQFVDDLTLHEVDAGHWVARTHPDEIAERVRVMTLSQG